MRTRVGAFLLSLVALVLSGCASAEPAAKSGCDWLASARDAGGPRLAVVDDRTESRASTAWPAEVDSAVDDAAHRGGTLSLVGVDGDAAPAGVVWADHPLMTPDAFATPRADGIARIATTCAAAAAAGAVPTRPGSDIVTAINAAVATLGPRPNGNRLYVLTDGYASAGPLRLDRGIDIGDSDPEQVAGEIVHAGLMADLTGIDVVVLLGDTAGPAAGEDTHRWMVALYGALCRHGGAARCDIERMAAPASPPVPGLPADPVVLPAIQPTVVEPPGVTGVTVLSSTAFFEPGSATLRPGATAQLVPLAARLRPGVGTAADIVGHVASWGSQVYRLRLSELRALAIRDALVAAGADPNVLHVRGAGSSEPVADDLDENGQLRPREAAFNRRVEVAVRSAP